MKAENQTTGHNRYIRVTEIGPASPLDAIELDIRYRGEGGHRHGITLDNHIIPRILAALNDSGPDPLINDPVALYDNFEIGGVCRLPDGSVEACDDKDATFWSLYGHIGGHGVECIGDFRTREAAARVFHRITGRPYTGDITEDMKTVAAMRS